ncbi:metallopeptidase M24 family protein [Mycolicibacterium hassiacum DSM 44199]|jgi:Xaa-Pro aminopeptidase|uniref:Metallopeptidase M24 family protein n=1 Tax=Mycolicibacterium hassiacum (strain DSM 44199 / CIP 105218 / JCM 12690 / 3849) TaxID=1122247 RepID=K5BI36_MYCHD|nr:Xaa-Pro peptidase family protein [Mycolicibacterium hassiacum]EKF25636.1 metallopeptidase M24 family protein [Mycolicibacterium hassiacum DSM 44199]MBX5485665.1 aminopeptidase P family protein [Mycolicibacterium hassiacum]MDA4084554.1 peptidase [Mycolicibacterium hassiacum DSM 44199]PZN24709.1 MAG: aminopeptidase P family protein [Mycolicibacterium hassiacum]VCT90910.1 putative dipeptidase PepE [Mycolicibacterium hassiacum DSM 44199]
MTAFATAAAAALEIPEVPDPARMYRETGARLRTAMVDNGVDALVLLGNGNVVYATGASWPLLDAGLSHVERPVAIVLADDEHPHLFMPFREGASSETQLPGDHIHPPLYLEFDEGVEHFAKVLADLLPPKATVAVDELTGAMRRAADRLFPSGPPTDAAPVLGAAKLVKTVDQIACIRRACRITEEAAAEVQKAIVPGVRQIDLSGQFVRRAFELGATANMLEAIWQVMPATRAEGTWTTHGDLALPLLTTERELRAGDVLWTDVSITYHGYCSDWGRTWLVGQDPTPRQQDQFRQWREILDAVLEVTRAGATSGDLARAAIAANGGRKPWLPHFYLGHGIGTNAAEMPMIGTDLGEEFDDNFVFPAGMALVLEPVVWEDGTGGYRGEEIIVITEDGYLPLTDYPYSPYGD